MSGQTGGRSRRLAALSLDDEAGATNVVQRTDKTVPLAIYGGSTSQGTTPLPASTQPVPSSGNVGSTTAPLPAQSAPPAVSTPAPSSAVVAKPTPTITGERAAVSTRTGIDKSDDEIEGPPMAKTPWVAIGVVGVVVVIIGVIAAVLLGGGAKTQGAGGAAPTKSAS